MESDTSFNVKEVGGINLDNYFPYQSKLNKTVYVHKRYSKKPRKKVEKEVTENNKPKDEKYVHKEDKSTKCSLKGKGYKSKKESNNESVLRQTITFAKNLVPLVIPPSEGSDQVFYTIKTCTKCKKKDLHEEKIEKPDDATFEKKKSEKIIETFKRNKKPQRENYSTGSVTHSSPSNTLDDINMNQSLSCTLSDLSDKRDKSHKNSINSKRKKRNSNNLHVSESFEGLATELNDAGETNIKIHIMNEKEKHFLSESIRIPIVHAVNECIKDLNDPEMQKDVKSMQKLVMSNSQKLDNILERLACIENHLAKATAKSRSPKTKVRKPSKLEQLGQDILNEKKYSSEEELPKPDTNRQRDEITVIMHRDKRLDNLGCGELPENQATTSVGVKTDRHRLPARFCWTDSGRDD